MYGNIFQTGKSVHVLENIQFVPCKLLIIGVKDAEGEKIKSLC